MWRWVTRWRRPSTLDVRAMDVSPRRLADGDTVPVDGYPESWSQRLADKALTEPTQPLTVIDSPVVRPYVANYADEDKRKTRNWWPA